jgi:hypothetical protein
VNTCETCKHWETWGDGMVGGCQKIEWNSDGKPTESKPLAWLSGYEDPTLLTKPNFGCVQWEAKP